ncbi:uncharacterized protein LOC120346587 [Styela clava]
MSSRKTGLKQETKKGVTFARDKQIGILLFGLSSILLVSAVILFVGTPSCSEVVDSRSSADYNVPSDENFEVQFHGHQTPTLNRFKPSYYGSSSYSSSYTSSHGSSPYASSYSTSPYGQGSSYSGYGYSSSYGTSSYSYPGSSSGNNWTGWTRPGLSPSSPSTSSSSYSGIDWSGWTRPGLSPTSPSTSSSSYSGIDWSGWTRPGLSPTSPSTSSSSYSGIDWSGWTRPGLSPVSSTSSSGSSGSYSGIGLAGGTKPSPSPVSPSVSYGSSASYLGTETPGSSPGSPSSTPSLSGSYSGIDWSGFTKPSVGSLSPSTTYGSSSSTYGSSSPYTSISSLISASGSSYGTSSTSGSSSIYGTGSTYGTSSTYGFGVGSSSGSSTSSSSNGYSSNSGTSSTGISSSFGVATTSDDKETTNQINGINVGSGGYGSNTGGSGYPATNVEADGKYPYEDLVDLIPEDRFDETGFKCGISKIKPNLKTGRVVGGSIVVEHSWPWMVDVMKRRIKPTAGKPAYYHSCGGTLVSPRHVISALHCFSMDTSKYKPGELGPDPIKGRRIYVGKHDHGKITGEGYEIVKIRRHPQGYIQNRRSEFDIVLITSEKEITFSDKVQPACLPKFKAVKPEGTWCWAYGWGRTFGTGGKGFLKQVKLEIGDIQACRTAWRRDSIKLEMHVCAGKEIGQDTCGGDSGGPLTCEEHGKAILYGVTSYGKSCATGLYAVYAATSFSMEWFCCFMANIPSCIDIGCNPNGTK